MGNASGEVSECADFVLCVFKSLGILFRNDNNALLAWCIHPRAVPALGLCKHWDNFPPVCTVKEGTLMGLQAGCGVLSSLWPEFPGDEFSAWFSLILVGIRVLLTIQFYSPVDFVSQSSCTNSSFPRGISALLL